MSRYNGPGRSTVMLLVLLVVAILLDRYLIAGLFPWMPGLAGVTPMLVFLDIPVPLPVIIDLPVIGLFFFFYWILLMSYPSGYGGGNWKESRKRLWRFGTGLFGILLCLVAGGVIFSVCSGLMSREVRNGIDSFGIQLDIYTPVPDHELIHLKGGMILLICLLIGARIFAVRMKRDSRERERTGSSVSEAEAFSGREIGPGRIVDPGLSGFQEKGRPEEWAAAGVTGNGRNGDTWKETGTLKNEERSGKWSESGIPEAARAAAISVPVVAPSRVHVN